MKKLMFLMSFLLFAGAASAATDTFSPTISQTFTPTWTPTATKTITATSTPTPGNTPIPQAVKNPDNYRVYKEPVEFTTIDGVTLLDRTPVANGVYMAAVNNQQAIAFAVATPGTTPVTRVKFTVPNNFDPNRHVMQLYSNMVNSTAVGTNAICVNVYRQRFNSTLGTQVLLGVTRNVNALPNQYSLASVTYTVKRVQLPMPTGLTQTTAGDMLSFEIIRTAGTGVLSLYGAELEFRPKLPANP